MSRSRELFEHWRKDGNGAADLRWDERREQYVDAVTDAMWEAWQAALESVDYEFRLYE